MLIFYINLVKLKKKLTSMNPIGDTFLDEGSMHMHIYPYGCT